MKTTKPKFLEKGWKAMAFRKTKAFSKTRPLKPWLPFTGLLGTHFHRALSRKWILGFALINWPLQLLFLLNNNRTNSAVYYRNLKKITVNLFIKKEADESIEHGVTHHSKPQTPLFSVFSQQSNVIEGLSHCISKSPHLRKSDPTIRMGNNDKYLKLQYSNTLILHLIHSLKSPSQSPLPRCNQEFSAFHKEQPKSFLAKPLSWQSSQRTSPSTPKGITKFDQTANEVPQTLNYENAEKSNLFCARTKFLQPKFLSFGKRIQGKTKVERIITPRVYVFNSIFIRSGSSLPSLFAKYSFLNQNTTGNNTPDCIQHFTEGTPSSIYNVSQSTNNNPPLFLKSRKRIGLGGRDPFSLPSRRSPFVSGQSQPPSNSAGSVILERESANPISHLPSLAAPIPTASRGLPSRSVSETENIFRSKQGTKKWKFFGQTMPPSISESPNFYKNVFHKNFFTSIWDRIYSNKLTWVWNNTLQSNFGPYPFFKKSQLSLTEEGGPASLNRPNYLLNSQTHGYDNNLFLIKNPLQKTFINQSYLSRVEERNGAYRISDQETKTFRVHPTSIKESPSNLMVDGMWTTFSTKKKNQNPTLTHRKVNRISYSSSHNNKSKMFDGQKFKKTQLNETAPSLNIVTTPSGQPFTLPPGTVNALANRVYDILLNKVRRERELRGR